MTDGLTHDSDNPEPFQQDRLLVDFNLGTLVNGDIDRHHRPVGVVNHNSKTVPLVEPTVTIENIRNLVYLDIGLGDIDFQR